MPVGLTAWFLMIMKDSLSKVILILVYVLIGAVIGYTLAMSRCKKEDSMWPQIKQDFNEYLDKMSKQTQEFDEKIKQLTEKSKKE